jgi:hypothetical protein
VDLANETVRKRKTFLEACQPVVERHDIVGDLGHVVDGNAGGLVDLEQQKVR